MDVRDAVPLSSLTTLRVGGVARHVLTIEEEDHVYEALAFARERSLPCVVIGEGSNLLAADEGYAGVVMRMGIPGMEFAGERVTVGAGVSWDMLVAESVARGLWGIENLSAIPGTVGAAPVQNIGAYGAALSDVFESLVAYDTQEERLRTFAHDACAFGYRMSRFKREAGRYIVLSVTLTLSQTPRPNLSYPDLARRFADETPSLAAIREAVQTIRASKFPDLREFGCAGSFFLNPVLPEVEAKQLAAQFPGMPLFPMPEGGVKAPLAWLLDYRHGVLDLRDVQIGGAFVWPAQPLVLATRDGARAHDVELLAQEIEMRVLAATSIRIEREVRSIK